MVKRWTTIVFFMLFATGASGQNLDFYPKGWFPDSVRNDRQWGVIGVGVGGYAVSMSGLYSLWYKDYSTGKFHFFDDSGEWQGVDKAGHLYTAYYLGNIAYEALRWTGLKERKSIWYGGLYSFGFQTTIELFDAFSEGWGFSWADMAMNTLGTAMFIGQQFAWHEQRFKLKFSYHPTDYAQYRPELLGETWLQSIFKDYNGHTYWLSGNISSFLSKDSKFPKWLNIAVGYGAEGMLGARSNPGEDANGEPLPEFERYKKFYLTIDVDLTRIKTRSKFLKGLFIFFGYIKIPAPAVEFNTKGQVLFKPFYF